MTQTKMNLQINNEQFWKKTIQAISMTVLLVGLILANSNSVSAQFTFMGDYDRTFAAPLGYYVDPQFPDPNQTGEVTSYFTTGDVMSDGSIVAAGQLIKLDGVYDREFYIKKFLPSGALDASFNGGRGFILPDFYVFDPTPVGGIANSQTMSTPDGAVRARSKYIAKLKVLPDNKILVVGVCQMTGVRSGTGISSFILGKGVCMMRFNPNGTLDTTFGTAGDFQFAVLNNPNIGSTYREYPGMVWTPVGNQPMFRYPAETDNLDVVIQPDGKILIAGTTRTRLQPSISTQRESGFLLRYTSQGALDASFGNNGAIHYFANPTQPAECTPRRYFFGVAVQPDGRILALGADGTVNADCPSTGVGFHGSRFVVTRWTANGQFETMRHLDNNITYSGQRESATTAHFTRDGSKIIVSGSYVGNATLVRLNVADLSVDTTFGTNGIRQHSTCGGSSSCGGTLYIKAIQPDGKLIGVDTAGYAPVIRFNPDGSRDLSFGNPGNDGGSAGGRGRLRIDVLNFNGASTPLEAGQILVRPNGRINLVGYSAAHSGLGVLRAAVSQQNTVFENGIYSDFTNDGKSEIAVFRPDGGIWHQLNSENNNYSAFQWGISTDKPAPADFDGDGKTDRAVFRDGIWYIFQSSNGQARIENFGLAGDLPRPGDFDGDGKADISVFRPSSGIWYRLNSSNGQFATIQFGTGGDVPMLGDYDTDGKTDFAVFRPSNSVWYILRSSDNQIQIDVFGSSGDIPLNGDFNGDSRADLAVFRPSNRTWYIARPTGVPGQNFDTISFGLSTDLPIPADYDNDGKTDVAVYRNGTWWILKSGNNQVSATQFGLSLDKPIPAAYLP